MALLRASQPHTTLLAMTAYWLRLEAALWLSRRRRVRPLVREGVTAPTEQMVAG